MRLVKGEIVSENDHYGDMASRGIRRTIMHRAADYISEMVSRPGGRAKLPVHSGALLTGR